mmetsp:Transcript_30518/g.59884  ORF Transcript_30518/g.59884 Transcript_30518/m.59884 type:complete len:107 (-) Transcript_30518:24-344(-)
MLLALPWTAILNSCSRRALGRLLVVYDRGRKSCTISFLTWLEVSKKESVDWQSSTFIPSIHTLRENLVGLAAVLLELILYRSSLLLVHELASRLDLQSYFLLQTRL